MLFGIGLGIAIYVVHRKEESIWVLTSAIVLMDVVRPDEVEGLATNEARNKLILVLRRDIGARLDAHECGHLCLPLTVRVAVAGELLWLSRPGASSRTSGLNM